jgi:hypothetical protein
LSAKSTALSETDLATSGAPYSAAISKTLRATFFKTIEAALITTYTTTDEPADTSTYMQADEQSNRRVLVEHEHFKQIASSPVHSNNQAATRKCLDVYHNDHLYQSWSC